MIEKLSSVKIIEQSAKIDGNKIVQYFATIELTFNIDTDRG